MTWAAAHLALATAVFAIGGATRWTVLALAVVALVAAGLRITSKRRIGRWPPLLVLLGLAAGLTALQLVPLPAAVLELLNPTGHELRVDAARALGEAPPDWMPLTLDPPGTLLELVKLGSYFALAWIALRLAATERGRARVLSAIGLCVGAAAALGVVHYLLDARTLYGLYEPRQAYAEFLGPLLNRNHFASLLAIGALLGGGLALQPRMTVQRRALWVGVALLCMVESLLIQSRGAAVGLAIGIGLFGALLALQRWPRAGSGSRRPDLLRVTVPATVVVVCALIMIVYFSAGGVTKELAETSADEWSEPRSKYTAWRSASQLIAESPWVGVGRGAFEPAFTRIHPGSGFLTYTHLENEYLQAVVDWGIPGALALALALVWTALVAFRRWNESPVAAAGLAALAAIAAQSVVDFGVELPGLAVPVTLILASLTAGPLSSVRTQDARRLALARGAAVAGLAVLAAVMATPAGRTLHEEQRRLRAIVPPDAAAGREAMARHPVDYFAPGYTAHALYASGDAHAQDLLNHALILHPSHPDLHRLAARMLHRVGRADQALVEYALAIDSTLNPVDLLSELVARHPRVDQAVRALSPDHPRPRRLVKILTDLDRSDIALAYMKQVVQKHPRDLAYLNLLAELARRRGDHEAAELAATRIAELQPGLETYSALARTLFEKGDLEAAERAAVRALEHRGTTSLLVTANLLLADIHIAQKDWTRAREQLTHMREQLDLYAHARRHIHQRLATVEEALGNARQAEWERQRARAPE